MPTGRDVLKLIVDADSAGAVKEFDKLGKSIKSSVGDADKEVSGFTKKVASGFDGLQAHSPKVAGIFDKMGVSSQQAAGMIATAIPSAALIAGAAVATFAVKSIGAATDLNEQLSKTDAVFGTSANTIKEWASTAATSFGQSKTQALEAASSFGNMFLQLGIGADQATNMSMKMTELASDFASFFNTNPADALDAIAAAFRGEFDAVQKFVPTINAAAVEQKALAMGLADSTKELTAQDKALAAYELIMTGAGKATGDFDKTSDSLANTQRTLGAQVTDLSAKFGTVLLPAVAAAANALSGLITLVGQAGDLKAKFDFLDPFLDVAKNALVPVDILGKAIGALGNIGGDTGSEVDALGESVDKTKGAMSGMATVGMSAAESQRRLNASFGDFEGRAAGLGDAMEEYATATKQAEENTRTLQDAIMGVVGGQHAINAAQQEVIESAEAANEVHKDGTSTMLQMQIADDKVVASMLELANANREHMTTTEDADAGASAFIDTLRFLSGTATPEVKRQLDSVILGMENFGAQHPEPTMGVNDEASPKIVNARDTLIRFGGMTATAAVDVTADTDAADRALQGFLSRVRNSSGMVIIGGLTRQSGGPIPGSPGQMVPVMAHGGEYVLSADVVDRIKQGAPSKGALGPPSLSMAGGGGTSRATYITINAGVGDPVAIGRAVKQAVAAAERAGVN